MSIKQVHYNIDNINKENALFNLIVGEKSNGKSYQVKHKEAILHYMDKKPDTIEKEQLLIQAQEGYRFILLRRWQEDISNLWIERYFADVDVSKITNNKYNCISCWRKVLYFSNFSAETYKTTRGEKIGYVMALSTEQHMSSASFLDVDRIIFEEFVERGSYLPNEPDRLMIFYSTIDRKRGKTKLYMVGNSISKVCPYFAAWGLDGIFRTIKQGEIKTKTIETENESVKLAVEFCGKSGGKSVTIGNASTMIDSGAWQTTPQPKLPKSRNDYNSLFKFGFFYKGFKFLCDLLQDKEQKDNICFYIYPYFKEYNKTTIVFSDIIKTSPYWQTDIYNMTIPNEKIRKLLYNFRVSNVFFSDDLTGTDFKQCIDFNIRR